MDGATLEEKFRLEMKHFSLFNTRTLMHARTHAHTHIHTHMHKHHSHAHTYVRAHTHSLSLTPLTSIFFSLFHSQNVSLCHAAAVGLTDTVQASFS